MTHRNNHLVMGKIEPLAGCQGFKCKSTLIPSSCLVVPPPSILTSLISQLKLSCQQWGESCTSPMADNFPLIFLHGLGGPSAWANGPLAGQSDLPLLHLKQMLQLWLTIEPEIFLFQARKMGMERAESHTQSSTASSKQDWFSHLIPSCQGVKWGAKDDPEDAAYVMPLDWPRLVRTCVLLPRCPCHSLLAVLQ